MPLASTGNADYVPIRLSEIGHGKGLVFVRRGQVSRADDREMIECLRAPHGVVRKRVPASALKSALGLNERRAPDIR